MSDHLKLYPEIRVSGSLKVSLQDALHSIGSELFVTANEEFFPSSHARVELGQRFVQIYLAAEERLFLAEYWAYGVALAAGNCSDLIETASAIHAWTSSEQLLTADMNQQFVWITPNAGADAYVSGGEVEWQWQRLLADTASKDMTHLAILRASREQRLRMLFPYTSLFTLCFSRCTGYPFTRDIPCISPVGDGKFSVSDMDGVEICRDHIDACIASVVRHLPANCGPAWRGTASSLG